MILDKFSFYTDEFFVYQYSMILS